MRLRYVERGSRLFYPGKKYITDTLGTVEGGDIVLDFDYTWDSNIRHYDRRISLIVNARGQCVGCFQICLGNDL